MCCLQLWCDVKRLCQVVSLDVLTRRATATLQSALLAAAATAHSSLLTLHVRVTSKVSSIIAALCRTAVVMTLYWKLLSLTQATPTEYYFQQ
jgi:hypothetical protein